MTTTNFQWLSEQLVQLSHLPKISKKEEESGSLSSIHLDLNLCIGNIQFLVSLTDYANLACVLIFGYTLGDGALLNQ